MCAHSVSLPFLFSIHRSPFLARLEPGYRQTTSLCPSVCHSMRAFDCTNFTGEKNAECTVLRRASLNYSTSLPLNSWFTLLSNTIMIVPPIEKRFFPLSYYLFFPITFEARGNTSCLCAVFRVTLYLKKKCG